MVSVRCAMKHHTVAMVWNAKRSSIASTALLGSLSHHAHCAKLDMEWWMGCARNAAETDGATMECDATKDRVSVERAEQRRKNARDAMLDMRLTGLDGSAGHA